MSRVKIVSSWSNPGGGTIANISLTNLLNDNGYDCTFYGGHDWHLNKCKGAKFEQFSCTSDDVVITHFIRFKEKPSCKKHILSCHEKNMWPINKMQEEGKLSLAHYDAIHFVSNLQKEWQAVDHPNVHVIPPLVDKIGWTPPKEKVAGIVGSVDWNKQIHKSINRALHRGYSKILIFGDVTDLPYFNEYISRYVNSGQVILAGHQDDREALYGQISEVFHSSLSETYGLVEAECRLSGIPFNGASNGQEILSKEEILEKWESILK
tara:strand:- start:193 stop:987 length:795 start_codon:yes stop_codon:yes gene_type:complete